MARGAYSPGMPDTPLLPTSILHAQISPSAGGPSTVTQATLFHCLHLTSHTSALPLPKPIQQQPNQLHLPLLQPGHKGGAYWPGLPDTPSSSMSILHAQSIPLSWWRSCCYTSCHISSPTHYITPSSIKLSLSPHLCSCTTIYQ